MKTLTLEQIREVIKNFDYNKCTKNWCDGEDCPSCKYNTKNMLLAEFKKKVDDK